MSTYREILAIQRPAPIGLDSDKRVMFSVNFEACSDGTVTNWEEEVVKILNTAGLATLGTDTFIGPAAIIPSGAGPYISIIDTGGVYPYSTHDGKQFERLSVQVVVRALSYQTARTRALAIWRALDGKRNITVAA